MSNYLNNGKYIRLSTFNYTFVLDQKNYLDIIKKIKIFNKRGIFVTGIPNFISIDDLGQYKYLGQYGKIVNIDLCMLKNNINKKTYSVFVSFENKISASIAIQCLNDFKYHNKLMKCAFSSNKICLKKFISNNCNDKKCLYFHKNINKNNSITKILKTTNKKVMEHFFSNSKMILEENINKLIIILKKDKNCENTIFPSQKEFLNRYINESLVSTNISCSKLDNKKKNKIVSFKKF